MDGSVGIQISEFRRCTSFYDLKHPHESGDAVKPGTDRGFRDIELRIEEQLFGMRDPSNVQIFIEGSIREFLEQPAEVVLGKSAHGGNFVKTQLLGAVTVDIVADAHELDDIFLLFGGLDVREFVGQGCKHPADIHHQLQKAGLHLPLETCRRGPLVTI